MIYKGLNGLYLFDYYYKSVQTKVLCIGGTYV